MRDNTIKLIQFFFLLFFSLLNSLISKLKSPLNEITENYQLFTLILRDLPFKTKDNSYNY